MASAGTTGPTIQDFNFGVTTVVVPPQEPAADDYLNFTIFHVNRVLTNFTLAGRNNLTVPGILRAFPVGSHSGFNCVAALMSCRT